MYMQKENGKRESPYKGILKFADEKKPQLSFAVVLSVLSSAWYCSIYRGCNLAAKGIGKQSDNDLGNPLAGYRAVRVSFEAYPLRKIDALLPQGSLRNYQKYSYFDYEKDVQGIYGNDSEQIVR